MNSKKKQPEEKKKCAQQPQRKTNNPFLHKNRKPAKSIFEMTDEELEKKIQEKKKRDEMNKERYYVNNADLLRELEKWRDSGPTYETRTKPSDDLGRMFLELARKISNHSNFRNYTLEMKQDMIGHACEKMVQSGLRNYNFKFTNAFAYFSQTCFNAFKTYLSQHYKQVNLKRKYTKDAILELDVHMPNSGMSKCLENQFTGNDFDDFSDFD